MSQPEGPPGSPGGEPPFAEPWQAQAFALAVALHERGLFTWTEWTRRLGREIALRPSAPGSEAYWQSWVAALESLLAESGLQRPEEQRYPENEDERRA